jgi:beta-N-acetylhexosaminidase
MNPSLRQPKSPLIVSYDGAQPDSELMGWVKRGHVSGVVIFRENATQENLLQSATESLRKAAQGTFFIMIDEEGGRVRRLPDASESMPDLRSFARGEPDGVAAAYAAVANRLVRLGIDTLLAPVVDLGGGTSEWLCSRTFSDDPDDVARMACAVIPVVQRHGINACVKHFPGMRAVAADPHQGRAVDATPPSEWDRRDAVPFRAAVTAGVRMIMAGHQLVMGFDPTAPACLSPIVVGTLLRQRLGFAGLVLSDDLAMGAITDYFSIERAADSALTAGCNLILVCRDRDLQRRAVSFWLEWCTMREGRSR